MHEDDFLWHHMGYCTGPSDPLCLGIWPSCDAFMHFRHRFMADRLTNALRSKAQRKARTKQAFTGIHYGQDGARSTRARSATSNIKQRTGILERGQSTKKSNQKGLCGRTAARRKGLG